MKANTTAGNTREYAQAHALIQSEISDGDEQPIELIGRYVGDKFEIENIKANGYTVVVFDFK